MLPQEGKGTARLCGCDARVASASCDFPWLSAELDFSSASSDERLHGGAQRVAKVLEHGDIQFESKRWPLC